MAQSINGTSETEQTLYSKKQKSKMILRTLLPVIIAVIIGTTASQIFIKTNHVFVVDGISMSPTLRNKELIFTDVVSSNAQLTRGDIVVVDATGLDNNGQKMHGDIIKRLVGLPGDTLQIRNGKLIINGEIPDEYQYEDIVEPGGLKHPVTLGEDEYIVIGDNRNNSLDSRVFGSVSLQRITNILTKELF